MSDSIPSNPLRSFPVDDSDGMQRDAYWAKDADAEIERLRAALDEALHFLHKRAVGVSVAHDTARWEFLDRMGVTKQHVETDAPLPQTLPQLEEHIRKVMYGDEETFSPRCQMTVTGHACRLPNGHSGEHDFS